MFRVRVQDPEAMRRLCLEMGLAETSDWTRPVGLSEVPYPPSRHVSAVAV